MKRCFLRKILWLIGCILGIGALSIEASAQFSGSGSGTSADPYRIFNASQLNQVRNFLTNGDVYFSLEQDIDISGWLAANSSSKGWISIGNSSSMFHGKFDGKNHTIKGISTTSGSGLFGNIFNAEIKDLKLEVDIKTPGGAIGGLAGSAINATISNVSVTGSIASIAPSYDACTYSCGGLVGVCSGSEISNCSVINASISGMNSVGGLIGTEEASTITDSKVENAIINGSKNTVGGFVGRSYIKLETKSTATDFSAYTNCHASANITSEFGQVGGFVGRIEYSVFNNNNPTNYNYPKATINADFTKCSASGTITCSRGDNVGGFIGDNYVQTGRYTTNDVAAVNIKISDCLSLVNVRAQNSNNVGGFMGCSVKNTQLSATNSRAIGTYSFQISDCYANGDIYGASCVGGFGGTMTQVNIQKCYASGRVSGTDKVGGLIGSATGGVTLTRSISLSPSVNASSDYAGRVYGSSTGSNDYGTLGTATANKGLQTCAVTENGKRIDCDDNSKHGETYGKETMMLRATYQGLGWNFSDIWQIVETQSYPYKSWQTAPPVITTSPEVGGLAVRGKSVAGAEIYLYIDDVEYKATCDSGSNWVVVLSSPLKAGDVATVYAKEPTKMRSLAVSVTTSFQGEGTEDDPYRIYTAEDLANVFGEYYYILMNDLDLSEIAWTPIGRSGSAMCKIDGNNHTISNLKVQDSSYDYCGLFASMANGSIKNLIVKDASVTGGNYSSILVGNCSNSTIENVRISGSVNGKNYVGGVAGYASSSSLSQIKVIAEVTATGEAGGIAGGISGNTAISLADFNNGTVNGGLYAGGITPKMNAESSIKQSTVSGNVSATSDSSYAGGIVAENHGSVADVFSTANVTSSLYVGGIAGINYSNIERCYASGNLKGGKYGAGISAYNSGAAAIVKGCVSATEKIELTAESPVAMRVLGGFREGAESPATDANLAMKEMIVTVNNVAQYIEDDPLNGKAITAYELKLKSAYNSLGWEFPGVWSEGSLTMPYLTKLGNTYKGGESIEPDNYLTFNKMEGKAGDQLEMVVNLKNRDALVGVQFDLVLPTGITVAKEAGVEKIVYGSRLSSRNFTLAYQQRPNGDWRVIVSPKRDVTIGGNDGDVVKITLDVDRAIVNGDYQITLKNVYMSDPEAMSISAPQTSNTVEILNDFLSVENITAAAGKQGELLLELSNLSEISGFQFDVTLPKGISIAKNAVGQLAFEHAGRTSNTTHPISYREIGQNTYRVICSATANQAITGNEGAICKITLDIDESQAIGDYTVNFTNAFLANTDFSSITVKPVGATVSVSKYIRPGDVNEDGRINVADISGASFLSLGKENPRLNMAVADVNGDGNITMVDVREIQNFAFNEDFDMFRIRQVRKIVPDVVSEKAAVYIEPFTIAPGEEKKVAVMLDKGGLDIWGFQVNVTLPKGLTFALWEDAADKHDLWYEEGPDTQAYVYQAADHDTYYSMNYYHSSNPNAVFPTSDKPVFYLKVKASADVEPGVKELTVSNADFALITSQSASCPNQTSSILVGDCSSLKSVVLKGQYNSSSILEFNNVLSTNTGILEVNLENVRGADKSVAFTTGNPNTLFYVSNNVELANERNVVVEGTSTNVVLTDGYDFGCAQPIHADKVSYSRTLESSHLQSLYLPFTAQNLGEFKVYDVNLYAGSHLFGDFVTTTQEAGVPVVIESPVSGVFTFEARNADILPGATAIEDDFIGSYVMAPALNDYYSVEGSMANPIFAAVDKFMPFRAYLKSQIATGINEIGLDRLYKANSVYSLSGIRVTNFNNLESGIYIVDGRKIYLKKRK